MDAREGGGEVSGLPIHKFTIDGEIQVKPCAEAWLSDRAAAAILSRGIMPVLSVRGRDAVQLLTLQLSPIRLFPYPSVWNSKSKLIYRPERPPETMH